MKPSPKFVKALNTLAVQAHCQAFYQPENIDDLIKLSNQLPEHFYILGEGSNTLFLDEITPVLVSPKLYGVKIETHDEYYLVTAAASENWHDLVLHCVNNSVYGLENLALIPGSVGAAPVQNIGAYGVELADFCQQVRWFCFESNQEKVLTTEQCQFKYRDSIFKHDLKNKGLITAVTLKLPKLWQPKITYAGLNELAVDCTAKEVLEKVIIIRQSKLPDPSDIPNAGSFFKNPIVPIAILDALKRHYGQIPHYQVDEQHVKLAAGWLIEQSGYKGYKMLGVGVHAKQALVLVNHHSESGRAIFDLAILIMKEVFAKFNVQLEPEVRLVTAQGEKSFQELTIHG
ncbi:UDP-N-acetylmuramate dehydrogenase [Thalassotalea atypica]|uniref:UDP-N-acetylmuramate dehydrogenase n=1 Tax=Thalassotalea atypica TaxID=2054316 RepID=UPI002573BEFE|nr:UDP-N-acetylmuramate dehydrogenase [Thalassotalea atypica]